MPPPRDWATDPYPPDAGAGPDPWGNLHAEGAHADSQDPKHAWCSSCHERNAHVEFCYPCAGYYRKVCWGHEDPVTGARMKTCVELRTICRIANREDPQTGRKLPWGSIKTRCQQCPLKSPSQWCRDCWDCHQAFCRDCFRDHNCRYWQNATEAQIASDSQASS